MTEPTPQPAPETEPADACQHCAARKGDAPEEHAADCPVRTGAERRQRARGRRQRMAAECLTLRLPEGSLERLDVIAERQGMLSSEWIRKVVLSAIQRAEAGAMRKKGGAA